MIGRRGALGLGGAAAVAFGRGDFARAETAANNTPAEPSRLAFSAAMMAVAVAGPRLVAAGERGIVLLSDDRARSWRQARSVPVSVTLTAIGFASEATGWIVGHGGVVLRTDDGGESWRRQLDGEGMARLAMAAGEQAGDEVALRNARQLVADGPDKPFLDLMLDDAAGVLAVGAYGIAARSENGGASWQFAGAEFSDPRGLHLYHLARDVVGTRYVVGEQGLFLVSHGKDFAQPDETPFTGTLFDVMVTPKNALLVLGLEGAMWRSVDGGRGWTAVASGVDAGLSSTTILPDGTIVVGTLAGDLLVSRDDGRSVTAAHERVGPPVSAILSIDDSVVAATMGGLIRLERASILA